MSNPHSDRTNNPRPIPDYYNNTYARTSYATVAAGRNAGGTSDQRSRQPTEPGEEEGDRERGPREATSTSWDNMAGTGRYDQDGGRRPETGSGTTGAYGGDTIRYDGLGCHEHEDHPAFFTPSYLRHSRHVQKLKQEYEEHVAHLKTLANRNPRPYHSSLSTSSSLTNLNKLSSQHVHRGPVQDVIERLPPPSAEETQLHPLPSRWNEDDKWNGLEILADGTEARFNGMTKTQDDAASVRSDHYIPKEVGIYYFEVTILSRAKDAMIGIGFSSRKANLNRLPGWEQESWAYHGDDGYVFACTASGKAYGPKFTSQDVIGCGINFKTGTAFFTKNGTHLGTAFHNVRADKLYPSVGMKKAQDFLRVNFGKTPFVFDIDGLIEQERKNTLAELDRADVSHLHPPDDENALIHNLIGQYLAHEGYVETAKAFAKDVEEQQQAFDGPSQPLRVSSEDDQHANHRQRIRRSILDGDIDRALKYLSAYYQNLFGERNRDIYFRLRCRKYVEMTRKYAELSDAVSSPTTVTKSVDSLGSNGHANIETDEQHDQRQPDTQMELDDQLRRETSQNLDPSANDDVDMDVSQELPPKLAFMEADQILMACVEYGQELQQEWKSDRRPHIQKHLQDIAASFAYRNIYESPISHLFSLEGRAEIAEEVNGAILVSLGKPSFAALEKVCSQTEVLLEECVGRTGPAAAAAFVNVRDDFLKD
ncbi:hypothetical protein CBER1_08927 [Cercospora berteroae]|uniref:Uncharacterized protein n=1 Tax=Cercospora berteroae TaxID=357750 RepID=A0A2S6BUY3_9PEZI|nr:hypothetical protein CBER1_08927 [Cercospora berteroae]